MDLPTALRLAKKYGIRIRNLSVGHNVFHEPSWPRDQFDRRRTLYSPDAVVSQDWELEQEPPDEGDVRVPAA